MKAIVAACLLLSLLPARSVAPAANAAPAPLTQWFGDIPLSFEANRGQSDGRVRFLVRGGGYTLFLTQTEAVLSVGLSAAVVGRGTMPRAPAAGRAKSRSQQHARVMRLRFQHANPNARIIGLDRLPGIVNYFLGSNPARWRTDVPTYARVEYTNIYPHVDLIFYSRQQQLEYDWVLHPGARSSRLKLGISGVAGIRLDGYGNIVDQTGMVLQQAPDAYQVTEKSRSRVSARYGFQSAHRIELRLGAYDRRRTLVVDPVISFATYLGGQQADSGFSAAVDSAGEVVVSGSTISADFPTQHALQGFHGGGKGDAFIGKFAASGTSLVYMTYFGGSDYDQGYAVTVDAAGDAYLAGETISRDFPTVQPFQSHYGGGASDGYVAELNPTGDVLLFSSYIGGNDDDAVYAISVGHDGTIYLAGNTKSSDFPVKNPFQAKIGGGQKPLLLMHPHAGGNPGGNEPPPETTTFDAFVAKISPARNVEFSTFLGGSQVDSAGGIGVDPGGNVIVAGQTRADDFPTTSNALQPKQVGTADGFITKFDPTGQKAIWSTYFGGNDQTGVEGLAIDSSGDIYVTGQTSATDLITKNAAQPKYGGAGTSFFYGDAFVTKFDPSGAVVYSTYLGGSQDEEGRGIAVDSAGNTYVTGQTDSADFPSRDAIQPAYIGGFCHVAFCTDAFLTKLDTAGRISFSTFLGGSASDVGAGVAVDSAGAAYVMGTTESRDMRTVLPIHPQNTSTQVAATDAFVVKIAPGTTPVDHSIVIQGLQMLHKVRGHWVKTTSLKLGETASFVVRYKDTAKSSQLAVGMLIVAKAGKEVVQFALSPGGSKARPDVDTLIQFKGSKQTGALTARVAVIRGAATTVKSMRFTVKAH